MKKIIYIVSLLALISCNNNNQKLDEEMIRTLNEYNTTLDASIKDSYHSVKESTKNPIFKERALFWLPQMDSIKSLQEKCIDSLYNIKSSNEEKFSLLNSCFEATINLDKVLKNEFKYNIKASEINPIYKTFSTKLFNEICKNKIKLFQSNLYQFCSKNTHTGILICEFPQAVANQNSTHFKPNENLEILAGVGSFNSMFVTQIKVDNKLISIKRDGLSEYKINVGNKKGKFKKRVVISFTRPDGEIINVEKEIKYTVD